MSQDGVVDASDCDTTRSAASKESPDMSEKALAPRGATTNLNASTQWLGGSDLATHGAARKLEA